MISSSHFQLFPQYFGNSQQLTTLAIHWHFTILHIITSFSIHLSNSFRILMRAPIITHTILSFHNFPVSLFKSSPSSAFPLFPFLFPYSYISWYSNIDDYHLLVFLVNYNTSGLLASITFSHWTLIFHNTFNPSFSTAPSGMCSYHFPVCSESFFLQRSQ